MSRASRLLALAAAQLLLPGVALAAGAGADATAGATRALLGSTLGLAKGLLVFALVLGLLVEAFGRSPTQPRDFAGCLFRTALVMVLLGSYGTVFGSALRLSEDLAARVAPPDVWERYARTQVEYQDKLFAQKSEADRKAESVLTASGALDRITSTGSLAGSVLGGYLFDTLIGYSLLLGQAVFWVFGALSRIVGAVLYVLGPLALVFAIPRGSGVGTRWLRTFATVLAWPVISGLLLTLTLEVGLGGMAAQGFGAHLGALASGLLLAVIAIATPVLASALIGGGAGYVGAGLHTMSLYSGRSGLTGLARGFSASAARGPGSAGDGEAPGGGATGSSGRAGHGPPPSSGPGG